MKRIVLFFIAFLLFLSTVEAQQSLYDYKDFTPYEKQRYDLADEAGTKALDALSDSDKLGFSMLMLTTANNAKNDYEVMIGIENMLCTMFGVASLTNPENANSYYEYRMTNQMKTIAKWYFDERAKIEKQKTQLDVAREKQRLSGFYALQQDVKSAFLKWSEKGTYEKREQYLMRIQLESISAFDSICQKLCMNHYFRNVEFKNLPYDVDNEVYSIKTYYIVNKQETSPVILTTNMSVDNAKNYSIPYEDNMVPINLYRYDGFLHSNKLLDTRNNYYFCSDFTSNEPVAISYDSFNINNEDLNSVMAGYVFNYNDYMTYLVHLSDSVNERVALLRRKIDNSFGHYFGRNWDEVYRHYNHIREPYTIKERMSKVYEYENQCVEHVKSAFSVYRPLFDSDDDFIAFFFNEKGIDEEALKALIKTKFDEFTGTIIDVKTLKESKDSPTGKKMLEFCDMSKYSAHIHNLDKERPIKYTRFYIENTRLESVSDYVDKMFEEFVLKNKVLKKKYSPNANPYYADPYGKYASLVVARYIIKGK